MKKNKIIFLLGILIPLLFTIGFSSWIIMYSFEFTPNYLNNPVSDLFEFSSSTEYNGEEQVPSPKNGIVISGDISYEYKLTTETEFVSGKPINAGSYDIKIFISNSDINGECRVKFTITKRKIPPPCCRFCGSRKRLR
jgi:hypothetical protein